MKATPMAKAADGNLDRPTRICQGGGNKLIRSPPLPSLLPAVARKWAHVQKMKLPNEIVYDAKPRELAYDRPSASLLLMLTSCVKLMLKGNNASRKWVGRKPPEVAENRHPLKLVAR